MRALGLAVLANAVEPIISLAMSPLAAANVRRMSEAIWPVVTENLAEQIAATQAGLVHSAELLPYLRLSLELTEQALDEMARSDRICKERVDGLIVSAANIFRILKASPKLLPEL